MFLTASHILIAEQCREFIQESRQKVEADGSTRFYNTVWNKTGSDGTSYYIDGLLHSVFAKSLTSSLFNESDAQIQTI